MVEGDRDSATGLFIKALPGNEEGIAKNSDFKSLTPEIPFQHIRHFKVTSDNTFNIGKNTLDLVVAFQRNQRQEFGNPDDVNTPDAWFDLKTINYAARFHLPSNKNWKTAFGLNGMYQTNTNRADEVIIPNYNLFDAGIFLFTQYIKNKWSLSGGLRFDDRHVEGKAMTVDNEPKFNNFKKDFSNIFKVDTYSYYVQIKSKYPFLFDQKLKCKISMATSGCAAATDVMLRRSEIA